MADFVQVLRSELFVANMSVVAGPYAHLPQALNAFDHMLPQALNGFALMLQGLWTGRHCALLSTGEVRCQHAGSSRVGVEG